MYNTHSSTSQSVFCLTCEIVYIATAYIFIGTQRMCLLLRNSESEADIYYITIYLCIVECRFIYGYKYMHIIFPLSVFWIFSLFGPFVQSFIFLWCFAFSLSQSYFFSWYSASMMNQCCCCFSSFFYYIQFNVYKTKSK